MKQQVNLYLAEFRVQKDSVTPLLMGQVLAGIVITMVVFTLFDVFTRWQLEGELAEIQKVLIEETSKTDSLDDLLAKRSQTTDLSERLAQAEATLRSSRQIAEFLGETKLGNVDGFSEYFKDLSRASVAGLALNKFEFSKGGEEVTISGNVAASVLVPRYVDNIKQGSSPLKYSRFSPSISRVGDGGQFFSFELSNRGE
jgi:hypothetical protein